MTGKDISSKSDDLLEAYRTVLSTSDGLARFDRALVAQAVVEGAEGAARYVKTRHGDADAAGELQGYADSLRADDTIANLLLLAQARMKQNLVNALLAGTIVATAIAVGRVVIAISNETVATGKQTGSLLWTLLAGGVPTVVLVAIARAARATPNAVAETFQGISAAFHAPDTAKRLIAGLQGPEQALFSTTGAHAPSRVMLKLLGPALALVTILPLVLIGLFVAGVVLGAADATPVSPLPTFSFPTFAP